MTHKFEGYRPYERDDFSSSDSEDDYSGHPRIVVGNGDIDRNRRWDRRETSDGLEPAWSGAVEEKGDVFYVEQSEEPHGSGYIDSGVNGTHIPNGRGKERRGFNKLKKIIQGKRSDDNKLHSSYSDPNILASQDSVFYSTPDHYSNSPLHKEVTLYTHVSPETTNIGGQSKLEALLGILPGRYVPQRSISPVSSPRRRSEGRYVGLIQDTRVMVQGLSPTGVAMKSGQINIGDCVLSINGMHVNHDNIDSVLTGLQISAPMEVKLQIERNNVNKDRFILQPRRLLPNGSLVKLISGERVQEVTQSLQKIPHVVMYLSLAGDAEDTEENKEMLYLYPENSASQKLSEIQGMFLTISDMLENVTGTRVRSSTVVINKQLLNVSYYKSGPEALVLAMPADRVSVSQLNYIVLDIARLLNFLYGSLHDAFLPSLYHAKLDHLFSLLFQKILLDENPLTPLLNSSTYVFLDTLPGVRWLDLPDDLKIAIDSTMSELEAADFADMSDEHYDDRRPYGIVGSCLFYRGYLLANHLPLDDFVDMLIYCRYHSLLTLASEARIGQLVVWREVIPTKRNKRKTSGDIDSYFEPDARHFLLIVGLKHGLLCLLLEAGGCAAKSVGNPSPDPFYVDQAKATLLHLEAIDIPNSCENRLSNIPVPALSCADWFFSSRSSTSEVGTPPVPGSPMLSRLHGTPQQKGTPGKKQQLLPPDPGGKSKKQTGSPSLDKQRSAGRGSAYEVDSDDNSDNSAYSPGNSQQSTPVLARRNDDKRRESIGSAGSAGSGSGSALFKSSKKQRIIPDPFSMAVLRKGLTETEVNELYTATKLSAGADNTLFHYVSLEVGQGIIVTPTHKDLQLLGGITHPQLLKTFHKTCLAIRHVFEQALKSKRKQPRTTQHNHFHCKKSLRIVKEHGVLVQCVPENWNEQKKTSPKMHYWVVGRLYGEPFAREVYVCYHESAPQNAVELAFKLSFGTGM
ncbi:protein inturned-like [Glandiceps talaboti]